MNPTPRRRKAFKERSVQRGWVGRESPNQPGIGDRFRGLVTKDTQIAVGHATPISRIVHDGRTTLYHLSDNTIITAPSGARITWEEA